MNTPKDPYGFLRCENGWANHLPLLLLALEATKNSPHPILQLGWHDDSTKPLHAYCLGEGRRSVLIDPDLKHIFHVRHLDCPHYEIKCSTYDESLFDREKWSVVIINNAPGERRKSDALRLEGHAEIIILRDSEPASDYGYRYSEIWSLVKSRVDIKSSGAWASAISFSRDLTPWRGTKLGPWTVTGAEDDKTVSATAEAIKSFQAGNPLVDPEAP